MKAPIKVISVGLGWGALIACGSPASRAAEPARVRVVPVATAAASAGFYSPNRAPLRPSAFMKLPAGNITPRGWLRHQLELDAGGLTGGLPEISDFLKFKGNGWVDPRGTTGWEEMPYWLRGYGDLGYVLHDAKIIGGARRWIDGILNNQQPDGWFGPGRLRTALDGHPDMWPHMLVLDALRSYYEYSRDRRVLPFMARYFKWQNTLPPVSFKNGWGAVRWADDIASIYWLYNRTGGRWLLDLVRRIHENSANYTTEIPTWHNVNLAQGIREPAEYWLEAGDPKFLNATEHDYEQVMGLYGQFPGGGFAGDENCRPAFHDPRQGFETCGIVEFMQTFEIMTALSGNPLWADRCENIAFNSLPAALSPDHKGIHYITSVNSIQLDNSSKRHGQFANGPFPMQAYKPGVHAYRCCPHNYSMGWPYYAENLWLATADRGLCASLYAASDVAARAGDGARVKIAEATDYPFGDTVRLTVTTPRPDRFPLYLRIPRWCRRPALKVNGRTVHCDAAPLSYVILNRTWRSGDRVLLRLPMHVAVRTWVKNKDSVSVNYGPLSFSADIKEQWTRYGGASAWPEYDVFPASPWNYGLVLDKNDPARSFSVVKAGGPLPVQPFTPETAPIELRVRARRIPDWRADSDGVIGLLQQSPVRSHQPVEMIPLIPMGAARLRVASFPTIGSGTGAHSWKVEPSKP